MTFEHPVTNAMDQAVKNGFGDLEAFLATLPPIKEQTVDTITENTIAVNSQCTDPRMKFVLERLVTHLHAFAKEVGLQTDEWVKSVPTYDKFILLSDILGLSALVNAQSNPKPPGCTESTILGPFHTEDAAEIAQGGSIVAKEGGTRLFINGKVADMKGNAIKGAKIDVWETDEHGFYDVQHPNREVPECRGIIITDENGAFNFEAILPVPYPIPSDGTVAELLKHMKRHCFRPAHVHFKIEAEGFETLVTAIYLKGDPFIHSDVVFGVRNSLIVDPVEHPADESSSRPYRTLEQNFVLPTLDEVKHLKENTLKGKEIKVV